VRDFVIRECAGHVLYVSRKLREFAEQLLPLDGIFKPPAPGLAIEASASRSFAGVS
jgi:hypothetical protein